jgi:hypothetical protein
LRRLRPATLAAVSLFKAASTVSLLTLASRVTGMVRDSADGVDFGASAMTDAFNVAFRLPNMFRRLFGEGAFSQAFVPVLGATRGEQGEAATRQLIDRRGHGAECGAGTDLPGGRGRRAALVWLMASGLEQNPRGFDAAVVMARWMFPYIGFMSLVALGAGILNTWKRFAVPAFTPVLLNLAMIAAIWFGAPWFGRLGIEPIYALALGVMVGGVLQLGCAGAGAAPARPAAAHPLGPAPPLGLARCRHPAHRHADGPALLGVGRGASVGHHQPADRLAPDAGQRELDVVCRTPDGVPHRLAGRGAGRGADAAAGGGECARATRSATRTCWTGACAWWCCWPAMHDGAAGVRAAAGGHAVCARSLSPPTTCSRPPTR